MQRKSSLWIPHGVTEIYECIAIDDLAFLFSINLSKFFKECY